MPQPAGRTTEAFSASSVGFSWSFDLFTVHFSQTEHRVTGDEPGDRQALLKRSNEAIELLKSWNPLPKNVSDLDLETALDYMLDPVLHNQAQGRSVHGSVCLHVDDLFMSGDAYFET